MIPLFEIKMLEKLHNIEVDGSIPKTKDSLSGNDKKEEKCNENKNNNAKNYSK